MSTLLYHDRYLDYDFGPEHPFSPVRQKMVLSLLEALEAPLDVVEPPVASREQVRRVHSEDFVEMVEAASGGAPPPGARTFGLDTGDVPVFPDMDTAARGLVGGTLHGARLIASGDASRVLQMGGGLHHAQADQAAGFCVYNDLSVAIDLLRDHELRVAYIDLDVHHGDGVQWLHYDDPDVLTLSLHESGRYLYPGTGHVDEIGEGAGEGTAVNVPLAPHTESESYLDAFERVVPYALTHFGPDVLVAQCGADAHYSDPLADLLLTTRAYEVLFGRLLDLADEHSAGRLLCTFGGGYRLDAVARIWSLLALVVQGHDRPEALPDEWREHWQSRLDASLSPTLHDSAPSFRVSHPEAIAQKNERTSTQVLELLAPHWY
ncbi:MAG: acetoin utilization protein AcuC [Salinivenus sp.]